MILFILVVSFCLTNCSKNADLVFKNGKVLTVDSNFSTVEAVAVTGDKISFVGSNSEVEGYIGDNTQVIDLEGRLMVPGLIDAHGHMPMLGSALENLDLVGSSSFQEIIDMVAEKVSASEPGEWILGHGWDQNDWDVKQFPVHDALSRVSPDNPVYLTRIDVHAGIANAKAIEISGVTGQTESPEGGKIHLKNNGEPTGLFIDNAMLLISSNIAEPTNEQRRNDLVRAADNCLTVGLTGVHDAGVPEETIDDYKNLIDNGRLNIRVYAMLSSEEEDLVPVMERNKLIGYGNNFLTVRSLKLLIDGALGSRGAAMIEDYSDDQGNKGLITVPYERIVQAARAALQTGWQVNTHAIGDRGNRLVLDAFETALKENPNDDHRFRIEHSQIVTPEDFARFAELNIVPSMQTTHCTSDMYWVQDRIGPERVKGAYSWRKFLDSGLYIPNGSDFPVESNNPMLGIYAAITRQDAEGWPEGGWFPDQKLTREEALKGFTIWAAESSFQEDLVGSIEVGKYADFTILSKDIMTIDPKEILTTKPVYTVVGGEIKYSDR
ncbi:MAG: amidohydrolase [bacterium]|nr:amidohydrolase [bacterium]